MNWRPLKFATWNVLVLCYSWIFIVMSSCSQRDEKNLSELINNLSIAPGGEWKFFRGLHFLHDQKSNQSARIQARRVFKARSSKWDSCKCLRSFITWVDNLKCLAAVQLILWMNVSPAFNNHSKSFGNIPFWDRRSAVQLSHGYPLSVYLYE